MKNILILGLITLLSSALSAQEYKGRKATQTFEQKLNEQYCTGLFQSTDGTIIDVASNPVIGSYLNVLEWLRGRVAGLSVYNSKGISIPVIRGGVASVYIDEMPLPLSAVSTLNIHDIAMIKIIKTPFYGGFNGGNGAIAIYTIDVEDDEEEGTK